MRAQKVARSIDVYGCIRNSRFSQIVKMLYFAGNRVHFVTIVLRRQKTQSWERTKSHLNECSLWAM